MHRLTFALATAAMLTLAGATPTGAEVPADFPTRPVTLVVPTVPSVTGDLLMRAFAEVASRHLGQQSVVPATGVPPCKSKAQCVLAAAGCSRGPPLLTEIAQLAARHDIGIARRSG